MYAVVLNLVENQGYVFKVKVAIKINIISIYSSGLQHIDVMALPPHSVINISKF